MSKRIDQKLKDVWKKCMVNKTDAEIEKVNKNIGKDSRKERQTERKRERKKQRNKIKIYTQM